MLSGSQKSHLRLATEVYADLALATTVGNLCHLNLDLQAFTGLDAFGRARITAKIAMHLPAYCTYGATKLSILVPSDAAENYPHHGETRARVVEIAPLQYGGELFTSPFFATKTNSVTHPMLQGDQVVRFDYTTQMADFHEWIITFCLTGDCGGTQA